MAERDPLRLEMAALRAHRLEIRSTLSALPALVRHQAITLFAASCADELFRMYDRLPVEERRDYSLVWRRHLEDVWDYAAGDRSRYEDVSHALGEFYTSVYSHDDGPDGPDDIDQDEAAAAYYAACAAVHGLPEFAAMASARVFDNLDLIHGGEMTAARQAAVAAEVMRQADNLKRLKRTPWDGVVPQRLVAALRR